MSKTIDVTCKKWRYNGEYGVWEGCPHFMGIKEERRRKCGYDPKVIKIVEAPANRYDDLVEYGCPLREETRLPDYLCD